MKQKNLFLILGFICLVIFITLTFLVYNSYQPLERFNKKVAGIFQVPDAFFPSIQAISYFGSIYFLIVLFVIIILFLLIQKKYLLLRYIPILFFGAGIHYALKRVLEIPRPENVLLATPSYPSSHSFGSAILYWILAFLLWKNNKLLASFFIVLPFLIALTRILLGVHWFTDVIAGLLLAAATISFFIAGVKSEKKK